MRIGIFTDSYRPYTSGVVTSIVTFKEELIQLGHEVYIFAPSYPDYHEQEQGVYRFYSLPSPTNPDFTLAIPVLPGIKMLVKKLNLDIIHVHSPFTMGRVGLHYARKYKIPIVFTYHTLYDQYAHYVPVAQELARDMALKLSNNFCNQCDHIIVPSKEVETLLNGYSIKSPVSVIPTGVPLHKFEHIQKDWLRTNYGIPDNRRILLFVGRLSKEKNLGFLIRAFRQINMQMPETTLVITAQGPLETELRDLARSLDFSLDTDVIFTGALPFETLVDVYSSSDLFVFSSMTETQGLVLIEAMASGLPVVAVRAYGVQDMVDDGINGVLTECERNEFCNAVIRVLNDEILYKRLKANAYLKAQNLSSANMALKLQEVYEKLAENSTPRRPRFHDLLARFGS